MLLTVLPAFFSPADVLLNETFESGLGSALASNLTTVTTGSGAIGSDNVADLNDDSATGASYLEYNAGTSAAGALYVSFDLLSINPAGVGSSGSNPMTFGIGAWDNSTGYKLNANAARALGLDIYHDGDRSNLKVRVGSSAVYTATYTPSLLMTFQIWVNDSDSSTLTYTRPDTLESAVLSADSFVVYLNGTLIGSDTAGYAMQTSVSSGDAVLGRVGFYTSSTVIAEFQLDDLHVESVIPEPATLSLVAVFGGALLIIRRYSRF